MKKHLSLLLLVSTILVGCETFPSESTSDSTETVEETTKPTEGDSTLPSDSTETTESTESTDTTESSPIISDSEESSGSSATEPSGDIHPYYQGNIDFSLTGAALKTDFHKLIKSHKDVGYDGLYEVYEKSDIRPDGTVWDMYSNMKFRYDSNDTCGNYHDEGDCFNREHTIPQSVFSKQKPMVSDAFHIYPTDGKVNGMRSNYPHAEVGSATYTSSNGSKLGTSKTSGVSGKVFEPIDEYKGDFARTYFYFVTCYQDKMSSMKTFATFAKNTYPSLSSWAIKLYLKWSEEDPVSQKEIDRNEAVYSFQNNRNPFIDFPGIEKQIWNA